MQITRKEISEMKQKAFEAFKAAHADDWDRLFAGGVREILCYRIEQGTAVRYELVQYESQMNDNTLRGRGFDPERATVSLAFSVDKQAHQLIPHGRHYAEVREGGR